MSWTLTGGALYSASRCHHGCSGLYFVLFCASSAAAAAQVPTRLAVLQRLWPMIALLQSPTDRLTAFAHSWRAALELSISSSNGSSGSAGVRQLSIHTDVRFMSSCTAHPHANDASQHDMCFLPICRELTCDDAYTRQSSLHVPAQLLLLLQANQKVLLPRCQPSNIVFGLFAADDVLTHINRPCVLLPRCCCRPTRRCCCHAVSYSFRPLAG
jgi:hypothetical protein